MKRNEVAKMYFLDTDIPLKQFKMDIASEPYVDKSMLIDKFHDVIGSADCYYCITRPGRFGKTMNANMLGAYYTKGYDTHDLFKNLKIAQTASYEEHINKYHVVYIDFSKVPQNCDSYEQYIDSIYIRMKKDLVDYFHIKIKETDDSLSTLFYASQEKFIFIMDEWDSFFYKDFMTKDDKFKYTEFLRGLLKDKPYVELAYMTGLLSVRNYSGIFDLNMFDELNFMNDDEYDLFFGFHEDEVKELCNQMNSVGYEELKYWYDGYYTSEGKSLFNPRSVSLALRKGSCKNYWTETETMSEITCIEYNVGAVKEDIVKMMAGIPVEEVLEGYDTSQLYLNSRDEILSAMVVYGFLSYHDGFLRIPNHELIEKFQRVLERERSTIY